MHFREDKFRRNVLSECSGQFGHLLPAGLCGSRKDGCDGCWNADRRQRGQGGIGKCVSARWDTGIRGGNRNGVETKDEGTWCVR